MPSIMISDLPDLDSEQPAVSVDVFLNDDNEVCENEPVASEPGEKNFETMSYIGTVLCFILMSIHFLMIE